MDDTEATGILRLLWQPDDRGRPGPKPRFTRARVVEAAIAVADASGLDATTMQRVADRLGIAKMAVYRYVPGRDELLALMLDAALGDPPAREPAAGWRVACVSWAHAAYERMLAHRWLVELLQRAHPPGPRELGWFEAGLAALDGLELTGSEKLDTLALVTGHAAGIARQNRASATPERRLSEAIREIVADRASEFPQTERAMRPDDGSAPDSALEFGLERILDGVEALHAARARA
ncbi:TetR/AcrR family transcriptional regulator [Galbitalea sp. SE-J8]|uniref:TetR/AcrR family transcriptional regulator n=1 Tax=Galbitalea sp. SE-J8 TaxID=3054952 RepID=UPI00259C8F9C|nr:TetR/AcrR family transcriptional regulator [Galbitalea sp. SE-J8]MDM4761723.1 TetR/AcrR family transcriptional regulator [Galbitalea sp. SE-J8]